MDNILDRIFALPEALPYRSPDVHAMEWIVYFRDGTRIGFYGTFDEALKKYPTAIKIDEA